MTAVLTRDRLGSTATSGAEISYSIEAGRNKGTEGTTNDNSSKATAPKLTTGATTGPLVTHTSLRVDLASAATTLEARWGANDLGSFPCPLPRHAGTGRLVHEDGDLRLGCCTGRWRSLGEVRMSIAYGRDVFQPTNIEIAIWTRRLAFECGTFAALQIPLPELPEDASPEARQARDGFALLLGLRWADGPHRPAAFSIRFAAAWCSLTFRQTNRAIRELIEHGVIRHAGHAGRTPLYEPGQPILASLIAERETR